MTVVNPFSNQPEEIDNIGLFFNKEVSVTEISTEQRTAAFNFLKKLREIKIAAKTNPKMLTFYQKYTKILEVGFKNKDDFNLLVSCYLNDIGSNNIFHQYSIANSSKDISRLRTIITELSSILIKNGYKPSCT